MEGFLVLSIMMAAFALLGAMSGRFGSDSRTDSVDVRGTYGITV